MTRAFVSPSEQADYRLFRPADCAGAVALVFKPSSKRTTHENGTPTVEVVADVTVFDTWEDLELGEPSRYIEQAVTKGRIALALQGPLFERTVMAGRITKSETATAYGTRPWVLADLTRDAGKFVQLYLDRRA